MMKEELPHKVGHLIRPSSKDFTLNDIVPLDLMSMVNESGAVVLKGFGPDTETFFNYTEKLDLNFIDYRGGAFHREQVNHKPTLMTVTGHDSHFPIPLHGELYYQKTQPDFLIFFCQINALMGGSSIIANAQLIYQELPKETQTFLENNPIKYLRKIKATEWPKVYKTHDKSLVAHLCRELDIKAEFDSNEDLLTEYVTRAYQGNPKSFLNNILPNYYLQKLGREEAGVKTADGKDLPIEIIKSIEKTCKLHTYKVPMRPGDILLVNNRLTLHGRSGFIGKRQIFLRMGNKR